MAASLLKDPSDSVLSSSESDFSDENCEDLSLSSLKELPEYLLADAANIEALHLDHNLFDILPKSIALFTNIVLLDISDNEMKEIGPEICGLSKLRTLIAKNNLFDMGGIPKDFGLLSSLEVLNLSGNHFTGLPPQFTELPFLRCLYMGGNQISSIHPIVKNLSNLEIFYLGGNKLEELPAEFGCLRRLTSLVLCNNRLHSIPESIGTLPRLKSLSLHNNQIAILPNKILSLNLVELSLRNNPLVTRFVAEMSFNPPSLLELAGRSILSENVPYTTDDLPRNLISYLKCSHKCVNPRCKGVFFTSRVEHVKFVDFCGKYRVPLLEYLCSPSCSTQKPYIRRESYTTDEEEVSTEKMRKVLLG